MEYVKYHIFEIHEVSYIFIVSICLDIFNLCDVRGSLRLEHSCVPWLGYEWLLKSPTSVMFSKKPSDKMT